MKIDAHQHFWRFDLHEYPWMNDVPGQRSMQTLRCDYLPTDLHSLLQAQGIDACIAVQARASARETDFLLELANECPWIAGVVGWIDLRSDDVANALLRWRGQLKLVGFRHQLQDEADVRTFVLSREFIRGIAALQASGFVYDVLVYARQMQSAYDLCARADRHWLVLDHLGKPNIRGDEFALWYGQVQKLAALPHVACKISGMVTEAMDIDGRYDANSLVRYLDAVVELFGTERILFGSDWPVCLLAASHSEVCDIVASWTEGFSPNERRAIWGENAQRLYGLAPALHV